MGRKTNKGDGVGEVEKGRKWEAKDGTGEDEK